MAFATDAAGAVLVAAGLRLAAALFPDGIVAFAPDGTATELASNVGPAAVLSGLLAAVGVAVVGVAVASAVGYLLGPVSIGAERAVVALVLVLVAAVAAVATLDSQTS
ncbi:MAG: hypothetical protein ACOCPX_01950 [Halapricum sp.]